MSILRASATPSGPAADWRAWWRERWVECDSDDIRRFARTQGFVLSAADLRTLGCNRDAARREMRRRRWWTPARGVVCPLPPPGNDWGGRRQRHALAAASASLLRPGQVVSACSAAILHGVPTLSVPRTPELTVPASVTMGRHGQAHLYSACIAEHDVCAWFGVPVTTAARTIVDLARHHRWDGLMAADAGLRDRVVSRIEIDRSIDDAAGWPGVRQARTVLELANPLAESPLESVTRLRMHDSGFPTPELQVEVPDLELGTVYRLDFLLRSRSLVIEADGRQKYTDDALWREKRRESRLRVLRNYRTERVIWRDVTADWPATRARLAT